MYMLGKYSTWEHFTSFFSLKALDIVGWWSGWQLVRALVVCSTLCPLWLCQDAQSSYALETGCRFSSYHSLSMLWIKSQTSRTLKHLGFFGAGLCFGLVKAQKRRAIHQDPSGIGVGFQLLFPAAWRPPGVPQLQGSPCRPQEVVRGRPGTEGLSGDLECSCGAFQLWLAGSGRPLSRPGEKSSFHFSLQGKDVGVGTIISLCLRSRLIRGSYSNMESRVHQECHRFNSSDQMEHSYHPFSTPAPATERWAQSPGQVLA